jgi:transposase-like protein
MPENTCLNGRIDQIDVDFVEREATPPLLMKLSIQLHLAGLSLSNTVRVLDIFGVDRAQFTVHNWVHKADLQPESGHNLDHAVVDETVIQLDDEQYWLYAAVDPDSNDLLHTRLEPTTNSAFAKSFFAELREKHAVEDAEFLIDGSASLAAGCDRYGLSYHYEKHGNRNSVERVFREIKRRAIAFSTCFSNATRQTADEWLRRYAFAWNQLI